MQIKMKTLLAGPGGIRHPGQVYEVSKKEGKALIEAGAAEAVETAPPETAAPAAEPEVAEGETVTPEKAAPEDATVTPPEDATQFPRSVPGRRGWYELTDGRHVRGKTNAETEQEKLNPEE